ncbi:MAG: glycine zipper 2TM domain-containing protein [Alkalilacustris sp.]
MRKLPLTAGLVAILALGACQMSPQERQLTGAVGGAAAGLLTASLLTSSTNWRVIGALAGAAAGALVAQNTQTGECAYAVGDGTFRTGPCPT